MENGNIASRITLRPLRLTDVDDVMSYMTDPRMTRYAPFPPLKSKEDVLSFIKNYFIPHPYCMSICVDDHSIGFISVTPATGSNKHRAELGCAIAPHYWSKGVATLAAKMVVSEAFRKFPGLVRIQSHIDSGNKASQKILEKLGFHREGVLRKYENVNGEIRDFVCYSFLSTDPIIYTKPRSSL